MNEANFRLALLSIREVELKTEKLQLAASEQLEAIRSLSSAMAPAFEGFSAHSEIQDKIIARLTAVETGLSELQKKVS